MKLKHVGNIAFIVGTLAFSGWLVSSPTSIPEPVLAGMAVLCGVVLIATFLPIIRRRSR